MEQIQPSYATPEQAKKLKEKRFNIECRNYYLEKDKALHEGFEDEYWGDYRCINWNADVIGIKPFQGFVSAPEQWQVVEWLRVVHGIWVQPMLYRRNPNDYLGGVYFNKTDTYYTEPFNSPQEAYSAAFDYILRHNLIWNK